jgi:predicted ATPase/DNA-binding CsgD family transcriptional regulator/Tfp pilus assembly protein PilF
VSEPLPTQALGGSPAVWQSRDDQLYALPGRVPSPLNALIGRKQELAAVRCLIGRDDVRLVTLTGPGGVGKTRVALAMAAESGGAFDGGVAFVPLAPIQDAALVPAAVAESLDVQESGVRPLSEDVIARIGSRRFLLILDNFEHLLAAAPLVTDLLTACPGLQVLATSRRRLDLSGEHEVPVPPLALVDPDRPYSVEELGGVPAIQLFVARAQAAERNFTLTAANGRLIAEICQRLDGLPLAIELAAPRTRLLSPAALLSRLTNRLQLLTGGPRDVPERLQTMRQAIAWSYDLLGPATQMALRQLAVFVGGFTLDGAEAIAGGTQCAGRDAARSGSFPVLDLLGVLVDESLLQKTEQSDGERRFGMLETVREYALERLEESGQESEARRRHAEYCLSLAEHADPWQAVPAPWLDRLQAEHDNLRAALTWANANDPEMALRLAGGLWRFWSQKGYWSEGRAWLEQALARGAKAPASVRIAAIAGVGTIAQEQSDYAEARRYFEAMFALAHESGDERHAARALRSLGIVASNQSDFGRAAELFEEALARVRAQQDQPAIARGLSDLGLVAERRNDHERAIAYYEEALPLARASGDQTLTGIVLSNLAGAYISAEDWARGEALSEEALDLFRLLDDRLGVAIELYNLGEAARRHGDVAGAWERYRESQVIISELGERQLASRILDRIAHLLATNGLPRPAAHLLGAAAAHRRQLADQLYPVEEEFVAETIATTRAALNEEAFQAAWEAGESLSPAQAVAEAMAIDLPMAIADPHGPLRLVLDLGLTTREVEVLRLVAEGQADKEIAAALAISRHTASKHVAALRAKLAAPSRTAAVAVAREAGLL